MIFSTFNSLASGGHIYYVGSDLTGIVGLIDASECPPTFGAGILVLVAASTN